MGGVILNIRFFISAFYSKSLVKLLIIFYMTKFFIKNLSLKSIFMCFYLRFNSVPLKINKSSHLKYHHNILYFNIVDNWFWILMGHK